MRGFDFAALLAAQNGNWLVTRFLIFVGVTLLLTILRKVAENREKTIRANTASKTPAAPPPKKDNPFRNEIEAFLEEVGKRRATGERPGRPAGDRGTSEVVLAKTPPTPKIDVARKSVPVRPTVSERAKSEPVKTVLVPAGPPA